MKKFVLTLSTFLVLMLVLQVLVGMRTMNFGKLAELQEGLPECEVLFLSSSVDYYADEGDSDKRPISRMLDSLQQKKVLGISDAAYHMEIFKSYVNYLIRTEARPELVIFEVNLRSFSPEWNMRPEYSFDREIKVLENGYNFENIFYRPLLALEEKSHALSQEEFLKTPVYKGSEKVGLVQDYLFDDTIVNEEPITQKFIFHYLYALDADHKKIKALNEMIRESNSVGLELLFVVSPIDYTLGEKYLPGEFLSMTDQNISFIKSVIESKGSHILDLSRLLTPEYFSYLKYPNEHLKERGRLAVASEISDWIDQNVE